VLRETDIQLKQEQQKYADLMKYIEKLRSDQTQEKADMRHEL